MTYHNGSNNLILLAAGFLSDYIWTPEENPSSDDCFYTFRRWREDYYYWRNGRYEKKTEDTVRTYVTKFLQDMSIDSIRTNYMPMTVTQSLVSNVIMNIHTNIFIPASQELNTFLRSNTSGRFLSLENGLLNLQTRELTPHTPDYFTLVKLPFNYDQDAICPLFETFLEQIMLGRRDYIDLILEFIGYLFRPDLGEQKFLLCFGEGANGKGVLFDVIQSLVGVENCSQVPLYRFGDRFALQSTIGKVCNLTNESSHIIENEAENILKSFVAGDMMTIDRKHRNPIEVKPTAKLLISTNALPRFNDKSQAVWRRILLVPFDFTVEEKNQVKNLAEELKKELPGILNLALDGLDRLNMQGFTKPAGQKELMEEYRRDTDPARMFLLDNYQPALDSYYIRCADVYSAYRDFCEENGYHPMNEGNFGKQVKRVFPETKRKRIGTKKREYVYYGLTS